jgi:hypothetical protein
MAPGKIVKAIRLVEEQMPAGSYDGTWSGNQIDIPGKAFAWRIFVEYGVRGLIPVTVTVGADGSYKIKEKP